MFLLELLRRNSDSDPALLTLPVPALLRCVMLVNELQGKIVLVHEHTLNSLKLIGSFYLFRIVGHLLCFRSVRYH